ncbi:hypothetical protein F0562_035052 [Nyssa sinensis]|uniref:Photosystem II 5 kDa protein, chloroplastic n=1 Tax=Nyssa sinensis TaxID=561372 RepID=A0A5J5ACY7_9ASTE|nr:hypothetical protein F0562_035052 [Nyssa sinensis]
MASITMTASFLSGSTAAVIPKQPATTARRGVVMAKASKVTESEQTVLNANTNSKEESNTMRRDLVFGAAAAADCSIAKVAMADEPKPGTPDAKKKYAPICVTMPTARICHKLESSLLNSVFSTLLVANWQVWLQGASKELERSAFLLHSRTDSKAHTGIETTENAHHKNSLKKKIAF